jgi:hypothetical protein
MENRVVCSEHGQHWRLNIVEETGNGSSEIDPSWAAPLKQEELSWYCIRATYKSIAPGIPRKRHLWQRIFFLMRAPENRNPNSLRKQAEELAREKEHEYQTFQNTMVRWVFVEVEDIEELSDPELKAGSEVYWEFYERVDKAAS